jgi:hypothetical protein
MSRRIFQVTTLAALALAAASLWAGFGGSPGTDAGLANGARAEWTPDLKSPDMSSGLLSPGKSYPETLARPLFSPTRKPPEPRPPEPVADQQPMPPEQPPQPIQVTSPDTLILKGIFIDDGHRLALVQTPAAPQGVWLAQGGTVEGWTVAQIEKQSIAIEANGQSASLTLYVDKPAN